MLYFLITLYIFIFLFFIFIFFKFKFRPFDKIINSQKKISIVVAAKNEEFNIPLLIESLQEQYFDKENYEVIIVDDNSTDSTFSEASRLTKNLKNYFVIKAENKIYKGKRGALDIGIKYSKYNYILITDADCNPEPDFLKSYSSEFAKKYDFIFGVAPFYQKQIFANKIACFDNLWVHILTFSLANIKLPYSAAARSFGFRKDSFNKIYGYKKTTETLSGDDDLLLREAVKNNLKIGLVLNKSAFVYSEAKTSIKDFVKQKSRHTTTSNYYSIKVKLVLGTWHILNIFMILSIFLTWFNPIFILLFLIKIIGDIIIIKTMMNRFGYNFSFNEIIYLQFLYDFFIILFFIKATFGKTNW